MQEGNDDDKVEGSTLVPPKKAANRLAWIALVVVVAMSIAVVTAFFAGFEFQLDLAFYVTARKKLQEAYFYGEDVSISFNNWDWDWPDVVQEWKDTIHEWFDTASSTIQEWMDAESSTIQEWLDAESITLQEWLDTAYDKIYNFVVLVVWHTIRYQMGLVLGWLGPAIGGALANIDRHRRNG